MKPIFSTRLLVAGLTLALAGCGGGGGGGATGSAPPSGSVQPSATPAAITLATSAREVKSDGSDSATITATVVDANNVGVSGATVRFAKDSGDFSASSGPSGADGKVTITYTAGQDAANRTESIVATVLNTSISRAIPIKVTGSSLSFAWSMLNNAANEIALMATAKDVANSAVANQDVRFVIDTSECSSTAPCGDGRLNQATTRTNDQGVARVTLTPTLSGPITIRAQWLNTAGNSTSVISGKVTATASGETFALNAPAGNNVSVTLGSSVPMNVSVPASISGTAIARVRLATTLGGWSNGQKVVTYNYAGTSLNESFVTSSSGAAGRANVQIDALSADGRVLATINRIFALSAAVSQAGRISLQTSVSNIAPSSGGTVNTAMLTATVRSAGSPENAVANAPVLFEILNSTGSGEEVSPTVAYTDSSGQARATFTSGSQSTVGGLQVRASVLDAPTTINDTKQIFVNASSASIALGRANTQQSTANDANYEMGMSVLVVDNAGTAVKNSLVTLSVFPTRYYTGQRGDDCNPIDFPATHPRYVAGSSSLGFANEDVNENDNLDPGEDSNGDDMITPAHAAAGSVPSTVTTDENGVATFKYTFQKSYANWLEVRVRAKAAIGAGTTESINELRFRLPSLIVDSKPCTLPNSPSNW